MSKLPIFELFLSVGNLKPKLKWFFKPKLKPKLFLLNWVPGDGMGTLVLSVSTSATTSSTPTLSPTAFSHLLGNEAKLGWFNKCVYEVQLCNVL